MFKWFKKQLDKIGGLTLDWVQVEVTTHCNGACIYCQHTLMKNRWTGKQMSIGGGFGIRDLGSNLDYYNKA